MDTRSPAKRSQIMAAVRQRGTGPAVRKLLWKAGYRYRLHRGDLPGSRDLTFASRRKIVFVHGCYWHGHGCTKGRLPKSRLEYWSPKIQAKARFQIAQSDCFALTVRLPPSVYDFRFVSRFLQKIRKASDVNYSQHKQTRKRIKFFELL